MVAKRNARERRRVQAVNQAFYKLRKCVPIENRNKRVSKVKTLQRAIDYIRKLERILAEDEDEQQQQQFSANLAINAPVNRQQQQQQQQADAAVQRRSKKSSNNCDQANQALDINAPANQQIAKQRRARRPNQNQNQNQLDQVDRAERPEVEAAVYQPVADSSKFAAPDQAYYSATSGDNCQPGGYGQQVGASELVLRESSAYNSNLNYYGEHQYQVGYLTQAQAADQQPGQPLEAVYALNYPANFYNHQQPHIGYLEGNQYAPHPHEQINSWPGKSAQLHMSDSLGSTPSISISNSSSSTSAATGAADSSTSFALLQSPSSSSSSSSLTANNLNGADSDNSSAMAARSTSSAALNKQQVSGYLNAYAVNRTEARVPAHLSYANSDNNNNNHHHHYQQQQQSNGRKTGNELALNGHHQVSHLADVGQHQLSANSLHEQYQLQFQHHHQHQPQSQPQMHQQSFLSNHNHTNHLSAAPNPLPVSSSNQQAAAATTTNNLLHHQEYTSLPI